ncbi:Ras interacting protein [Balamuthia mandrillaris]
MLGVGDFSHALDVLREKRNVYVDQNRFDEVADLLFNPARSPKTIEMSSSLEKYSEQLKQLREKLTQQAYPTLSTTSSRISPNKPSPASSRSRSASESNKDGWHEPGTSASRVVRFADHKAQQLSITASETKQNIASNSSKETRELADKGTTNGKHKEEHAKTESKQNKTGILKKEALPVSVASVSSTLAFAKEEVKPINHSVYSLMTETVELIQLRERQSSVELTIFLPSESSPLRFRVHEETTGHKVIEMVLKKCEEEKRGGSLIVDPGAYVLRMAEDDGTVDEDDFDINLDLPLVKFGDMFVLLVNASYQDADLKVGDLLYKVCFKRQLPVEDYCLQLIGDKNTGPLSLDALVESLNTNAIQLREFTKEEKEESSKMAPIKFYSQIRFTQYEVTKLGRLGKQDRIIGIDRHRITFTNGKGKKSKSSMKRPVRQITELKRVAVASKHKPRQFTLEFHGDNKAHTYEAASASDAQEIVAKLQLCLDQLVIS